MESEDKDVPFEVKDSEHSKQSIMDAATTNVAVSMPDDKQKQSPANTHDESADKENEADSMHQSDDSDFEDGKKDADTSKAVTFAEDVEIYDMSSQRPTLVPVSLQDDSTEPDTVKPSESDLMEDGDLLSTVLDPSKLEIVSGIQDKNMEILTGHPHGPSELNFCTDTAQDDQLTSTSEERKDKNIHEEPTKVTNMVSLISEDGVVQKEFLVSTVEESQTQLPQNAEILQANTMALTSEHSSLHTKTSESNGTSNESVDGYQDTIGPLENPAFLKTLNYTVSQVGEDDEDPTNRDSSSLGGGHSYPPNMDGGWAWVVLVAAIIGQILMGATIYTAGIFINEVLDVIDPDLTTASWIGAVHMSSMCAIGPFVGAVVKQFNCRIVLCVAGVIMALGFFLSAFATTTGHLIFTHGLIGGLGTGFIYNPLIVVMGQYFCRYRGLACGLACAGAGLGTLFGGVVLSLLLEEYGLHGAYLIWSGLLLHIVVIGMLIRPPPSEERLQHDTLRKEQSQSLMESHQDLPSMLSGLNSLFSSYNPSLMSGIDRLGHGKRSLVPLSVQPRSKGSSGPNDTENSLLKTVLHKDTLRPSYSVLTNQSQRASPSLIGQAAGKQMSMSSQMPVLDPLFTAVGVSLSPTDTVPATPTSFTLSSYSQHALGNMFSSSSFHVQSTTNMVGPSLRPQPPSPTSSRGPSLLHRPSLRGSRSYFPSTSHISRRLSQTADLDNVSHSIALVSQFKPYDVIAPRHALDSRSISTLMGSVGSLPTGLAVIKDDLSKLDRPNNQPKTLGNVTANVLESLRLLGKKSFLMFLLANFLWSVGESPLYYYLPSYAESKGISKIQIAFVFTAIGLGTFLGRVLAALVSGNKDIGPLILFSGCLGVSGLFMALVPLSDSSLVQLKLTCGMVTLYSGALVPLTSLITIDLLGISELSTGFGFLSLTQGLGYLVGPPVAGVIVSRIGYEVSFPFSGFILLVGSLAGFSVSLFLSQTDDMDEDSLVDLERVFQGIDPSNSEPKLNYDPDNQSTATECGQSRQSSFSKAWDEGKKPFRGSEGMQEEAGESLTDLVGHDMEDDRLEPILEEVVK